MSLISNGQNSSQLRRTKIVATLGPASNSSEVIGELLDAGVDIFRLNFSHGSHEDHASSIAKIREESSRRSSYVGILGDLQGPKIRLGDIAGDAVFLEEDQPVVLTTDAETVDTASMRLHVTYSPLPDSVAAKDILLLDDGRIRLIVKEVKDKDVHCSVIQGGELKSRKGINRLGGGLSADAITKKDLDDLQFIIKHDLDYVAVSFPCAPDDLLPVKNGLQAAKSQAKIISKIERAEAVATNAALDALINASDGVMVARGDLGVEIGDSELIGVQKKIIQHARNANKPVITATQMMESMITEPVPTRAEVFDVANAVLDGTDAVMLSAETATGAFPAKVVGVMAETALGGERHPNTIFSNYRVDQTFDSIDECIAMSTMYAANHLEGLSAIVCLTESGTTPLLASRINSSLPIYGMSRHKNTCQRMALYRGVIPLHFDVTQCKGDIWQEVTKIIAERGELQSGQRIAITCGDFAGEGGSTNSVKIIICR